MSRAQVKQDIGDIIDGKIKDEGAIRILKRIEETGATAEEIAGAVDAMMARCVAFPAFHDAFDVCGTGGDYKHSFNISTATAIVLAACGVKVAKHGNRAVTSKSGSADVLQALGVNTTLNAENCAKVMNEVGLCFLFAPTFHPGLGAIAPLRARIGHRTIFNLLGPLCNPAQVDRQLIGVYEEKYCKIMAEAARLLGRKQVMVVHGKDGSDELSIIGDTAVCELRGGNISHIVLSPKQAGVAIHKEGSLAGGDARDNAKALRAVLEGEEGAHHDAIVLNAAAALFTAGAAGGLRGGAAMAREALAKGDAKKKLEHLVQCTQKLAAEAIKAEAVATHVTPEPV